MSEYAHHVSGAPSGLTDRERSLLMRLAIRNLAQQTSADAQTAADAILTRAAAEQRDLSPDELAEHQAQVVAEREANDRIEEAHAAGLAELRAAQTRRSNVLSRQALDTARAFRSAILSKNPAPIEVYSDLPDEWPDSMPEVQGRVGQVHVHTRDTLKSTATQAMGTAVYGRIVQHLVETSSLMAAGATVITTATGEDLVVPKSTGFVTSAIIGEGASITESDPTLATVTLKAFSTPTTSRSAKSLPTTRPPTCSTSWPARPPCRWGSGRPGTAMT
jgi:HK97 family phage major capsid protein